MQEPDQAGPRNETPIPGDSPLTVLILTWWELHATLDAAWQQQCYLKRNMHLRSTEDPLEDTRKLRTSLRKGLCPGEQPCE
ncbi:hypothetical protein GN956_G23116 [Arapaima gigas]